jgi:hypothetical protein
VVPVPIDAQEGREEPAGVAGRRASAGHSHGSSRRLQTVGRSGNRAATKHTMTIRLVGLTLLGLVVGVVVGYPVGAAAGMLLVGPLVGLGVLHTETGGWTESNVIGGILWLAAGAVVGLCQQWPQRTLARRQGVWWVLGSAALWALVALASVAGEGRLRAVDLRLALPVAALCSLAGGAAVLLVAAGDRRARPAP